ncbi:MAG: TolC family protein [Spirochaetales bacterium]|nr:TolC family protein [Spirochaetales bacterium]
MTRSRGVTPSRGVMRGRPAAIVLAVGLLFSAAVVAGQDTTAGTAARLTLELAAELAVDADNQVAVLQRRLQDQLDDLGIAGYLDDISLKLTGSMGGDVNTPLSTSGSAVLSAGVEIIPQLVLAGSLSAIESTVDPPGGSVDPLSGSVGLTFNPFADPTGRDRAELAAESAAADLVATRAGAAYRAVGSLIDAVSSQMELELLLLQQEVAIRSLADTQALYDRDRATDQQLTSAEDAVRTGAERIVRAELSLDRAQEVLARDIGVAPESIQLPSAGELDPESFVGSAVNVLESVPATELAEGDVAVVRAVQDVRSAQLDLESTHRFTPHLSITASGGLPDWRYSVGAELTVSPADWDGTAVRDAESDLAFAEREYEYAVRIAEYDALSALNELQFSLDDLGVAQDDLSDSRQDLAEADFRFGRGDITQLALDQARLRVTETEHDVTTAMLNVVRRVMAIDYGQY